MYFSINANKLKLLYDGSSHLLLEDKKDGYQTTVRNGFFFGSFHIQCDVTIYLIPAKYGTRNCYMQIY